MNNLYDINFQSNDEFYEIHIRYNVIYDWFIVNLLISGPYFYNFPIKTLQIGQGTILKLQQKLFCGGKRVVL
jgi:hypothetical protein